ncbi:MAG: SRPBCC family protein [Ferruginibacter sp.]
MKPVNNNAPVFATKTILINAKPEKIWAKLTNINAWNTWLTTVSQSKLNGPLQPNTTFDFKAGGIKIHSKLHTVEPCSNFGWTGKVYGISAIHNWTFKNVNGATEVTVGESMKGFLAILFKKSFNKSLEKDMIKSLDLLKQTCE